MKKNLSRLSAAMLPVAALTGCADKLPQKPNIVFLLFDDMGYGDLGCYGQELIETPNIDALAQQGIIFTDMYSSAPISAPSRCSIITGKHAGHSQIRANEEAVPRGFDKGMPDWYFDRFYSDFFLWKCYYFKSGKRVWEVQFSSKVAEEFSKL